MAALFVLCVTALGFVVGGFFGGRVFARGMALDRMIDALGGVMVGTVAGFIIALVVVRSLSSKARLVASIAAVAIAAAMLVVMQAFPATPVDVATSPTRPTEAPFEPPFSVSLLESDGSGPSTNPASGLPWKTLTVRTLDSGWSSVSWDDPSKECRATLDRPALTKVAAALQAIPVDTACDACTACVRQALVWTVGSQGQGADRAIDRACLLARPQFAALIGALREVENSTAATRQCAPVVP